MLSSKISDRDKRLIIVLGLSVLMLAMLARLLITLNGHDYSYFLPRMLDNHLFYAANGLQIKEYTASFCAGIFEFANPQSMALSLPQLLSGLVGLELGIHLTYVIAAAASGLGLYGCARYAGMNRMPAAVAGLLMGLGGFLLTRFVVGHLAFFNIGFAPLIAMLLLGGVRHLDGRRIAQAAIYGGLASLLATSVVYGGAGVMLLQITAMVMLLVLVCGVFNVRWPAWLTFYGLVSFAAFMMSGPKLEAMLAVTANLPRDFYPLPGFSPADLLPALFQTVVWVPDSESLNEALRNRKFRLDWHAWNYSVSPLWIFLVAGGLYLGRKAGLAHLDEARRMVTASPLRTILVALLLLLPLVLNLYTPEWNRVLKSTPVIGSSSNMARWFVLYMPLLCLVAGWSWRHLEGVRLGPLVALLACLGALQFYIHNDRLAAEVSTYNSALVTGPWHDGGVQKIDRVGAPIETTKDGKRRPIQATNFDHIFIEGVSNALCYEPMFGYRLESLDRKYLRISGLRNADQGGRLPMKNPACYVYPKENDCRPGDHFRREQALRLELLTAYGDPGAATSSLRSVLDLVAGLSIPATVLIVAGGIWQVRRRRVDGDGSA